jgi:DNA-binding CsgD family transcriptional regulator
MRFCICLILIVGIFYQLNGQEIPLLKNYTQKEYRGANQNWSIAQDARGNVYVANGEGILKYNGVDWQTIRIKDQKLVRSLCIDKDRLYIGAYGEFGFIDTRQEKPTYQSLSHLITSPIFRNEEVWNIIKYNSKIILQSFGKMFVYDGKQITEQALPGNIMFAANIGDTSLLLPLINGPLTKLKENKFLPLTKSLFFNDKKITGIIPYNNEEVLISTEEHGVYLSNHNNAIRPLQVKITNELRKYQINKTIRIDTNFICFGTISNGIYLLNQSDETFININRKNGLNNNTVLALFYGQNNDLWVGLDKGICKVDLTSGIQQYVDLQGKLGTIYTYAEYQDKKYLGTNQGLYQYNSAIGDYIQLPGISGQVWDLVNYDDCLFIGHNTGTHLLQNGNMKRISNEAGGWHLVKIPDEPRLLLQSTYNGLVVYEKTESSWLLRNKIQGIDGPIERIAIVDKSHFWLCGPDDKLRKVVFDANFQKCLSRKNYDQFNVSLPSLHKLRLNGDGNELYVFQNKHTFKLSKKEDCFYPIEESNVEYRYVNNSLFKIYNNGVIQQEAKAKNFNIETRDFYNSIYADSNFFVSITEDGYYKITNTNIKLDPPSSLKLVSVAFDNGKSHLLKGTNDFESYENNPVFYFENPTSKGPIKYRYILEGPVNSSSDWDQLKQVKFMNLSSGKYKLAILGSDNTRTETTFTIDFPWYAFRKIWWIYSLLFIGLGYLTKKKYDSELIKASKAIEAENARKLKEYLIELDNQKLREENLNKARDLANSTMESIKKNQILEEIKEELIEIRRHESTMTTKDFQKMMQQINQTLTTEKDNKLFDENFFDLNEAFFKKLLDVFPELTADDLKLAVYLKMNLSTKEIAPLFNISLRGLENKRYRLRKKMGLDSEVNLTEFFIKM